MTALLLGLSIYRSYATGQDRTMYVPPYRVRETLAIALSEMRSPPLNGYLAYRSIRDYLAQHGLAVMDGEASPMPPLSDVLNLLYDGPAFEKLMRAASETPIDETLVPITLNGNDKGDAAYYYWAFTLFGLNINALLVLYYAIIGSSALLFFITFWRSPFSILLLMLYLIGHYYLVGYAAEPYMGAVHNSRFFGVPALLPALHLLLLLLRRTRPTPATVAMAAVQTFFLMFFVFCRTQAIWQALAIVSVGVAMLGFRPLWHGLLHRGQRLAALWVAGRGVWPASLVVLGLVGLHLYVDHALDRYYYSTEARSHVFWHAIYGGTISASPELSKLLIGKDENRYGDNHVYEAVLADLRARHDASPAIAYVQNGEIMINAMKNMGVYDQLVRHVFFRVIVKHPWLVLKSFVYDKPHDQILLYKRLHAFDPKGYPLVLVVGIASVLLALFAGAEAPALRQIVSYLPAMAIVTLWSFATTMVSPSDVTAETLLYFIMLALLVAVYFPLAALRQRMRHASAA